MGAMMKVLFTCLLLCSAWPVAAHNCELALAPIATAYRAQLVKLAEKRDAALRAPRDAYLVELESAEEQAALKKDPKLVEAIGNEIKAVKLESFRSPEGFPRRALAARKVLEKAIQQAESNAERDVKKINASYLADLNRIPVGQGASQLLIEQIASEKKALANGIVGPVINPETDMANTKWWEVRNPQEIWFFTYKDQLKLKDVWRTSFPKPDELIVHWNDRAWIHMKLAKNGRMLLEGGQPIFVLVQEDR